jgi:hypothetical protein
MLMRSFNQALPMGKAIYGKVQTANKLDLYRNYIGQNLRDEDFQRLISAHILAVLRAQRGSGGESTMPAIAEKELRERIEKEPSIGIEFVREDLLPAAGLLQSLQREAEESARTLAVDFSTAYSRIANPLTGKLAIQWLRGNALTLGEMRDLGVTLPRIEKPEQAWLALRFLLEAFRRAELLLLLCMDEHERVTIRSSDEDKKASWGLLKDLAEAFVATGHLLIVAGVSEAWNSLPEDVFARIRRQDIVEITLDRSEGPKLLRAWAPETDKIFSPGTLERLCDVSQNNARTLLDLAHEAYKVWDHRRPLAPESILDATRSALGDHNRKASLGDSIEDCALGLRLTVERDANFRGAFFDYVLSTSDSATSSGERRCILVQVSESAFLLDEIDHGRQILEAQKQLAEEHDRIRTCAVMIGYSSLEVRDALERVVDRVLVYDEAKFRQEFQEFASTALADMSSENPPVPVPQFTDATRILYSKEAARSMKIEQVEGALSKASAPQQRRQEEFLARQADEQMAARMEEVQSNLLQESKHLIRLSNGHSYDRSEALLQGVSYVNAQFESLRRIRNLCERENAGIVLVRKIEEYRSALTTAESLWQQLLQQDGATYSEFAARIRESVTRRRNLLHELEDRWLVRRKPSLFWVPLLPIAIALALGVLILGWLGLDYRREASDRQQAMAALRKSLTSLVEFSVAFQNTGYNPKTAESLKQTFGNSVGQFETAMLNPAIPPSIRNDSAVRLRDTIGRVRLAMAAEDQHILELESPKSADLLYYSSLPSKISELQSGASAVLEVTYARQPYLREYIIEQRVPILFALALVLWAITWPYLRRRWLSMRAVR